VRGQPIRLSLNAGTSGEVAYMTTWAGGLRGSATAILLAREGLRTVATDLEVR